LRLGSATRSTDVTRSVRAFIDMQKTLSFFTGSSSVLAFQRDTLPVLNLARQPQGIKGPANIFEGINGPTGIFASTLGAKNALQDIVTAKNMIADIAAAHKLRVGLVDVFPASSFVAQLQRHPLPLSSRTFVKQLPHLDSIASVALPLRDLGTQMRAMRALTSPNTVFAGFLESQRRIEIVAVVVREWEGSALWFLIGELSMGRMSLFHGLSREQVEDAIVDALEVVVTKSDFVAALEAVVAEAPHLSDAQRKNLMHGLGHVARGEYVIAIPNLMHGLEGAMYSVARARSIIDGERRLLSNPRKLVGSVEMVVREMQLDQEYRTFLHRRVFGTGGNAFRHGDADDGERQQALAAVVAVSGWVDAFMGLYARSVLVELMEDELPRIVERASELVLEGA
jgi:hypothetical protein